MTDEQKLERYEKMNIGFKIEVLAWAEKREPYQPNGEAKE